MNRYQRVVVQALQTKLGQIYDPHVFLSWDWFSVLLVLFKHNGLLPAVKHNHAQDYGAFCALLLVTKRMDGSDSAMKYECSVSARVGYTGFICRPEHEDEPITAIASHIKERNWASLWKSASSAPREDRPLPID